MNAKTLYFSFNGRIGRKQYWINYVLLFSISITIIFAAITFAATATQNPMVAMLNIPVAIMALWGALAVSVKRFHDRDKKGWWVLISLVPVVGSLWLLIENGFLRGTDGPNRFGDEPLESDARSAPPPSQSRPRGKADTALTAKPGKTSVRPRFATADLLLVAMMGVGAVLLAWSATQFV